ncbi:MAG TPA: hypothetical protein VGP87_15870, partial [Gemmatimonadales bacterium]|nr:hypothetical protein [Gemmatimonadales bacterium]
MRSIRWRLTLAYGLALVATIIAFGTTLYITRKQTSLKDFDEALQQRLEREAELSARYLTRSHAVLGRIVTRDPAPALEPTIAPYFEAIGDYLLLSDSAGRVLYFSPSATALPFASLEQLRSLLHPPPPRPVSGIYTFDPTIGPVRYLSYPINGAGPEVAAVLVAAPSTTTLVEANELLSSMLVIAPLIMVASLLVGYWVAGRSLKPLGAMVNEVEVITDSRSLHRRLAV